MVFNISSMHRIWDLKLAIWSATNTSIQRIGLFNSRNEFVTDDVALVLSPPTFSPMAFKMKELTKDDLMQLSKIRAGESPQSV